MTQTVKDFVTNPVWGGTTIDETPCAVGEWNVTGIAAPSYHLSFVMTIDEATQVPVPWKFLWKRPATRFVR